MEYYELTLKNGVKYIVLMTEHQVLMYQTVYGCSVRKLTGYVL